MASIDPFLESSTHSFDPEATRAMGEAFEAACRRIPSDAQPGTREQIARQIIENAKRGEQDPTRLCEAALASLTLGQPS
jgi:hypothetical protein